MQCEVNACERIAFIPAVYVDTATVIFLHVRHV